MILISWEININKYKKMNVNIKIFTTLFFKQIINIIINNKNKQYIYLIDSLINNKQFYFEYV